MFRKILRQAIQAANEGRDSKGILRILERPTFVQTSAESVIRDCLAK
jgi:hypothetical protein